MAEHRIEISVKGRWITVPGLEVNGKTLIVRGGPVKMAVVHDEEWLETEIEDPELYVKQLKKQRSSGLRADVFTFAQKLPATLPKYGYATEWDSVAAIRLTTYKDWWEKLPQETRKNVRRSQKRGVSVTVKPFDESLVRAIGQVNDDSPVRQGVRNTHYGKSLDQLKKDYSSFLERSDFICAYLEEEMIGFLKLVYRGEVASLLNLTVKPSHHDKRSANALMAKAVELCIAKGITNLIYGLFNYGNKGDNPLREFKVRNGFEEILVPRFFVPLTIWGALAVKLGLHRGLHGLLPRSVIAMGVAARAKWYYFKQSMGRCSSMTERPNRTRQTECSNPPAGSTSQGQGTI